MDLVDDFFDSIPWDKLKDQSTKVPISEECRKFLDSFIKRKEPNPNTEAKETTITNSKTQAHPPASNSVDAGAAKPRLGKLQFPRLSSLTNADHASYLSARYCGQVTSQSLQIFQKLHSLVVAEQKEFNEWLAKAMAGQPPLVNKTLLQMGTSLLASKQDEATLRFSNDTFSLHKELPMKKPATSEVHLKPIQHLCSSARVKSPGVVFALINASGKEKDVPLTVRAIKDADGRERKLFVIDKPLPAKSLGDYKKMTWAAKKAAKRAFLSYREKYFDFAKMSVEQCKSDFAQDLVDYSAAKSGHAIRNHVYSLWCLEHKFASKTADTAWGRQGCPIHLLVRSQCHGFFEGAEALDLAEFTQDWVSMILRPEAILLRARVDAKSLKVVQVEHKDLKVITKEARAKEFDSAATLGALHSLLAEIIRLQEGRFLLRINPKGAVVHAYGPPLPNHSSINLSLDYKSHDDKLVVEKEHSIQIDPEVVTPLCLKNQRIPATFLPRKVSKRFVKPQSRYKKGKKVKL
ncbi:Hypothetical predicted protein [Cloeon dipterum]|uniref:Little elongation complex subunit 2 C-terminal domain-containing protein n=1 Tax=Cloeon dipterum TaxID=197152 RepID=A0A8S1CMA1_9INSE|nr:Hypothetical predicted protein [Cloeon dipterum]